MELLTEKYKQTEIGLIPSDWEVKTLGDIGDVKMCKRVFSHQTKEIGEIPFYKIGTFGKEPDAYISIELYNDFRKKFSYPSKGDVLISAAGTIGRTIKFNGEDGYFQDSNIVWIDNKQNLISNEYLHHILQIIKYNTEGGTIQRLYNSILKSTKFVCPTDIEQTLITKALSDTDEWIAKLEQLLLKKQHIKQSALQELFKVKPNWNEVTIASLSTIFTKQTGFDYSSYIKPSLVKKKDNTSIPFIQNKDFKNKWINFDTDYFIPINVAVKFPRILLNERCLLISISGSVGNVGIFCNSKMAFVGGAVAIVKFKNIDELDWVMYYLLSDKGQNTLLSNVKSGSHKNLILEDIRKIKIPFPTIKEQKKTVAILSDMDLEIEQLETKIEKAKKVKQGMMQELLTGKTRLV